MICLEEAQQILHDQLQHILFPRVERVPLWEAGGRVLAMELVAEEDVPRFDRSLVTALPCFRQIPPGRRRRIPLPSRLPPA